MAQLPDVYCWIKLIDQPTGKVIPNGAVVDTSPTGSITIRYVVANDSNKPTGNFAILETLKKDGKNLPLPVPSTVIELQPKGLWKHEHTVNKNAPGKYEASMWGDLGLGLKKAGGFVVEEDEKNNIAKAIFTIKLAPP